jgi:putative FmdB family regulatory protein
MPVYEHYCPDCHTIFSFFSRRVDTDTRPACPRCARPNLERQVSLFAISKARAEKEGGGEEGDLALPAGLDEERLMRAFASLENEMGNLDDEDPRQAARLMRRLFESAGLKLGDGMVEAMRRM